MTNNNPTIRLVATDLDGTFLKGDKSVTDDNLRALHLLGEEGIIRVIATGRNLEKTREVVAADIPFDFIVFSSGAGVFDCRSKELIYHRNMSSQMTRELVDFLVSRDLNFQLFRAVPENHRCWYHQGSQSCAEFDKYLHTHRLHAEPLPAELNIGSESCQFLVVFPNKVDEFLKLKSELETRFDEINVVRTSSPMETGYIWMEIFHKSVSKGNGVKFICDLLGMGYEDTAGIGNDFNDLDLLSFTRHSYVVENSPDELKSQFQCVCSNEASAFAEVVDRYVFQNKIH